jgi:hypothetical protein
MEKPKSKFVQNELKKTSWSKRQRIENLMRLEAFAESGGKCYNQGDGIRVGELRRKYSREFKAIANELNPKFLERERKEDAKERRLNKEYARKEREKERIEKEREKREWKKLGGKN